MQASATTSSYLQLHPAADSAAEAASVEVAAEAGAAEAASVEADSAAAAPVAAEAAAGKSLDAVRRKCTALAECKTL